MLSWARRLQRRRLGLVTWIVLLGTLGTLPFFVFAYVNYRVELRQARADAQAAQIKEAEGHARDLGLRLDGLASQLRLIARVAALADPDLPIESPALSVGFLAINDAPLPVLTDALAVHQTSGRPVLSPFFMERGEQVAYLSVARDRTAADPAGSMTGKIAVRQLLGGETTARAGLYLVDQKGVVARSSGAAEPAPPPAGNPRVPVFNSWQVVVNGPAAGLHEKEARLQQRFLLGSGLSLLVGATLLLIVARNLRNDIEEVITDFGEFAEGGPDSVISEFAQIGGALASARAKAGQTAKELERAKHDSLTGLPGRELFLQQAAGQVEIARRTDDYGIAVIYMDLDGFKSVNDRFGHKAGDEVLQRVATMLRQCVRSPDALGRMGGDEFVVCFAAPRQTLSELAARTAERITESVARLGVGVECSAGWAIAMSECNLLELIDEADAAMYLEKSERKRALRRRG